MAVYICIYLEVHFKNVVYIADLPGTDTNLNLDRSAHALSTLRSKKFKDLCQNPKQDSKANIAKFGEARCIGFHSNRALKYWLVVVSPETGFMFKYYRKMVLNLLRCSNMVQTRN